MKLQKRSAIFNLGAIIKIGALSTIAFLMLSNFWSLGVQAMDPVNGTSGDCVWEIDTDGNMVIKPTSGEECTLANSTSAASRSYHPHRSSIITIKFEDKVYANTYATSLFYGMPNLIEIDFSNFDTSKVTSMRSMFNAASSLTSLDLSGFDTSNVTTMYTMFSGASSLTNLDLSSFDTGSVTTMYSMFSGTNSLTNLNLSSFDTSNVTDMSRMFYGASSLVDLDLSNFNTGNVTNMSEMFRNASSLTELDLSNFDTSNVTNMQRMFNGVSSLNSLDLSSFNTSNVTNMRYMFSNVSSVASLDLSSFDTSNVTNMGSMFSGTDSLVSLNISSFDTTNTIYMDGFLNKGQSGVLREISLGPKTDLKRNLVGLGIWRQEETGELYRGTAIKKGPGTFIKVSDSVEITEVPYTVDYRINPIPKIDSFTTTNPEIFKQNGSSILAEFQLEKVDEYTFPGKFEVLFKDAVSDRYDNTYDLKMTVENIKLYDLDMITNNYDTIYQEIFKLDGSDVKDKIYLSGAIYLDYDLTSKMPDSNNQSNVSRSYDITFNILKDRNPVEGSYLFSAYDLDGDSYRDRGSSYDTSQGRGYGNYSEGVNFYEGFDLDSAVLSEDTILQKIGENRYTGTWKNDPSTVRTEIIIKADARESKFTWTTGGNMGTTLFYKYQPRNIEISKKDQDGNFVTGATLEVYQGGSKIYAWESQLAPEKVWLNPGFYTLKETSAPEGYEKTDEEIEFIVDSDNFLLNDEIVSGITLTNQKKPTPPTPPKPDEPDAPDTPDEGAEPEGSDPAVPDTGHNTSTYNQSSLTIIGSIIGSILISFSGLVIYKAKSTARKFD